MSGPHIQRREFFFISSSRVPHPDVKRFGEWLRCNQEFYVQYDAWLRRGGYQKATRGQYGHVARVILGWLNKPYDQIELETDLGVRLGTPRRLDAQR